MDVFVQMTNFWKSGWGSKEIIFNLIFHVVLDGIQYVHITMV